MRKIVRWGILSTAKIAQDHLLPAFVDAQNAEVIAIASSNSQVYNVAETFKIKTIYPTYEELLEDPNIDAVYIPLPNGLHREWAEKAAKKGKHILCEKPAALTAKEAQEMIDVCKEYGVMFLEAFMYQFHPQHQRVKEIIVSGEIGEVKSMRASFSFFLHGIEHDIRRSTALGGGSLYDVGCYCLHSIGNILNATPEEVFVSAQHHPEYKVDMSVQGIVKLNNGLTALFDASMEQVLRNHYEVIGTKGKIEVPRAYLPNLFNGEGLVIVSKENGESREEKIVGQQYVLQVEAFSQWVLDGNYPNDFDLKTIQNMQAIEMCLQSIERNSYVKVSS
ncbi:Gfo/Idh/MocA family protein [Neobacillus sp. KR4-4]|uniref:Gfo/Idh/MocA family protein n=1 Tax=Neobacillus sp. KR4-4 TaxID=3344872 RepID=UPI0035CA2336